MSDKEQASNNGSGGFVNTMLNWIERVGNKLPDPAILFLISMVAVWILSWILSYVSFDVIDPRSADNSPIVVNNQLTGTALTTFLSNMVTTFTGFAPLGVVLVAMLGIGVADSSGFIQTGLKKLLNFTAPALLTPMVIFVGIVSHSAVDAGYVLVIPLGGVIFYAAGRHPLAGIAAAFAGVSGGFSANPIPSALDPLLQGFTQPAAQILDANYQVNPLCNYYFTAISSILIVLVGWFIADKIIEPRLNRTTPVDDDAQAPPEMKDVTPQESKAFFVALGAMIAGVVAIFLLTIPEDSVFRDANGRWDSFAAPIMRSIVPLIFLLFWLPGIIYGFMAGGYKKTKDIIDHMSKAMEGMAYYVVMAFFCALFIYAFNNSNIGALLALNGAAFIKAINLPYQITIIGIIFLTAFVNLFVGSASAKWALLAPIFVPMLMDAGISPELTQAAYRVGDSSSNIITPLMPYFPLVVVFCQQYVKKTGIGTLVSLMIPFFVTFIITWTIFLLIYWFIGIPLGFQAGYEYVPAGM